MEKLVDVVVVGAGPVGLLTAIELTLGGARVLVLERLAAPSMVLKAGGIGPLGIEALQRRGMAVAIAAAQERTFAAMEQFAAQNRPGLRGRGSRTARQPGGSASHRGHAGRSRALAWDRVAP